MKSCDQCGFVLGLARMLGDGQNLVALYRAVCMSGHGFGL
jgi:hypothetical protein